MNPFERAREMVARFERDTAGMDADGSDMQRYDETRTNYGDESWEFVREMAAGTDAYTVVMDWDSSQGDAEAVAFHVRADSAHEAIGKATDVAWEEYGDRADYLYGVLVFEGHAKVVRP